jgi:hypothetical protein
MGENEMLIRRALQGRDREAAAISVKFGAMRDPSGGWIGVDGRPVAVKNFLASRCGTSAPITSTSTGSAATTRRSRSRRRSGRSAR